MEKKKKCNELNQPTRVVLLYALLSVVIAPTGRQTPFHGPRNKTRWKHKKCFCETTQPPPPPTIYYYGARIWWAHEYRVFFCISSLLVKPGRSTPWHAIIIIIILLTIYNYYKKYRNQNTNIADHSIFRAHKNQINSKLQLPW